jgi:hypothetical protein
MSESFGGFIATDPSGAGSMGVGNLGLGGSWGGMDEEWMERLRLQGLLPGMPGTGETGAPTMVPGMHPAPAPVASSVAVAPVAPTVRPPMPQAPAIPMPAPAPIAPPAVPPVISPSAPAPAGVAPVPGAKTLATGLYGPEATGLLAENQPPLSTFDRVDKWFRRNLGAGSTGASAMGAVGRAGAAMGAPPPSAPVSQAQAPRITPGHAGTFPVKLGAMDLRRQAQQPQQRRRPLGGLLDG